MRVTTEAVISRLLTTADDDADMTSDDNLEYLHPPMWNESQLPYLGDLTPKPTWEIIVKVRYYIINS